MKLPLKFDNVMWIIIMSVATLLSFSLLFHDHRFAEVTRELLTESARNWTNPNVDVAQLQAFYSERNYRPVWIEKLGPLPRAKQLLDVLKSSGAEGLEPGCYHVNAIEQLWSSVKPKRLGRLELLLSDAFMKYSRDVRQGRLSAALEKADWQIETDSEDYPRLLREILQQDEMMQELKNLPPPQPGYKQLRLALHRYQALAEKGGWPSIAQGPKLWPGMKHKQVPLIRQRLQFEGYLDGKVLKNNDFDVTLSLAVKRFQAQHGLPVTGIVGPLTRVAMNVPIAERIATIRSNMERWRWLPRELGQAYLMVNTAGYELTVYEDKEPQLLMRIIAGKPERPTPIVAGKMSRLVINPYWVVPKKIALEDIIPKLLDDSGYLKKKNIRIFKGVSPEAEEVDSGQVDWTSINADYFPFVFRQEPGTDNSMGRIKFIFVNDFDVYLHDTPYRALFQQRNRAFSSGCIRVEDPVQLASYLLGEEGEWGRVGLEKAIAEGKTETVPLPRTLPIYLVYWTAWVGENQMVNFRDDTYKWDDFVVSCH